MSDENSDSDRNGGKTTKKRKTYGRLCDASKKIRAMSHTEGEPCHCTRFKCFIIINKKEREQLLRDFNLIGDRNKQSSYLSGLITILPVCRRRPRKSEECGTGNLKEYSYTYKVRVMRNSKMEEIQVCQKAFISMFGITNQTIITLKKALVTTGQPPVDMRGKHFNRPHAKTEETKNYVNKHLSSLKGRKSHYSLKKTTKVYLPEELNITKLYNMYMEKYPNNPVSYEYYRNIFSTEYNISFGYPRKDSCSKCDEIKVKKASLEMEKANNPCTFPKDDELKDLNITYQIHLRKAQVFYDRKRAAKFKAKSDPTYEAICIDYMKNVPCPNLSTNDVYYRRQLSLYLFNIHTLSTNEAIFYAYDETVSKKGCNDVCSLVYHFVKNFLDSKVKHLSIFLDSCAGQNKNFTVIRFLHSLCTEIGNFDSITIHFPERGHSYMEPDKDMGLIKQNVRLELPEDWIQHIADSRSKPSSFKVFHCNQDIFKDWQDYLLQFGYKAKAPFLTRPIKEMKMHSSNRRTVEARVSYNGPWSSYIVKCQLSSSLRQQALMSSPAVSHTSPVKISKEKYNDLQVLKKFCSSRAQDFFNNLAHS